MPSTCMVGRVRFLKSVAARSSRLLNEVSPLPKLSSCDTQGGPVEGVAAAGVNGGGRRAFLWHTAHTDSVFSDPTRSTNALVSIVRWSCPWQCQQWPYLKALAPSMPVVEVADADDGGASVLTSTVPEASREREASNSKARPSRSPSISASKRRSPSAPSTESLATIGSLPPSTERLAPASTTPRAEEVKNISPKRVANTARFQILCVQALHTPAHRLKAPFAPNNSAPGSLVH